MATESPFYFEHVQPTVERLKDSTSQKIWISGGLLTAFALTVDQQVRKDSRHYQWMDESTARWGDRYTDWGGNVLIAATQFYFDRENGVSHIRSLTFTALTTWTLKGITYRPRPHEGNRFSFPSGHTSSAFATATNLQMSYGWRAGLPAYLMATWTGLSRLADDQHWLSDVIAGATLGILWGRAGFFNSTEPSEIKNSFMPIFENQKLGFLFTTQF